MDSHYTYEYMGLTPKAARSIYNDGKEIRDGLLRDYGEGFNSDFLECSLERYIVKRVNEICDDVLRDSDDDRNNWVEAMTAAGIKKELQDAIMDEKFEAIRGTQSLQAWLEEIFGNYFRTLEHLDERVLEQEQSSGPIPRGGANEDDVVASPPPGHRVLFKSIEFHKAQSVFSTEETDNGEMSQELNFVPLHSGYPTDFCCYTGLYFTDALWVAKTHALYLKRTCPPADIWLLELHVPIEHFEKLEVLELGFDDTFKKIVWYSRRGKLLPMNLLKIQSGFEILHGPCTTQQSKSYAKMKEWNEIMDKHLLTRTTTDKRGASKQEVAIQYMWISDIGVSELTDDCKGKAYLRKSLKGRSLKKNAFVKEKSVL
ncbi:hypothetical protein COCMIDRAFT_24881 [Bipolaris oryzae ATCC 44560]|uniref:Uncharacterized protein n=1 Tax=Bipolaris oryzae ATCC 44560 TaxID=930090 RepID=W6ZBS6_COCMI|nr:uncharacterized protein COCMIDRAFT_24881 [Bipolaris oryzae ATCC 44560]EUC47263.1 hypothetical protein COCMIDRAFT_24881 [Bipolaris oryzae ATCC 44560]